MATIICALSELAGIKSYSSEYKALEPREIIEKERLNHREKMLLNKNIITHWMYWLKKTSLWTLSEIAFENDIVEDIFDCVEKGNELINQFLIERIYHKRIPLKVQLRNKFKSFRDAVEQTELSSCWKQNLLRIT